MKIISILLAIASICLATPSPRIGDFIGIGKAELAPRVTVTINDKYKVKTKLQDDQGTFNFGSGSRKPSYIGIRTASIESGPMGVECMLTATQRAPASPRVSGRFTKWDPFTTTFRADGVSCFIPKANVVRVMVTPAVEKNSLLAVELAPNGRGKTRLGRRGQTYPIRNAFIVDGPSVTCSIVFERSDSQGQGQFMQSSFTNSRQLYGNLQKASDLRCERKAGRANLPSFLIS